VEDLRVLNTHVLRWTTPPDDPDFQLILPKGYADKFKEQVPSLPDNKRILFREHVVRKGDTLAGIARQYGSTIAEVSQANSLGKKPVLKVGQSLVIPMSGVSPAQLVSTAATLNELQDRPQSTRTATKSKSAASSRPATYTVRAGDTLVKIAARFNTTVEKLKSWNHLTSNRLVVGTKLIVSAARREGRTTPA
jgi:peptidoglycan lytic transglycosylase D